MSMRFLVVFYRILALYTAENISKSFNLLKFQGLRGIFMYKMNIKGKFVNTFDIFCEISCENVNFLLTKFTKDGLVYTPEKKIKKKE